MYDTPILIAGYFFAIGVGVWCSIRAGRLKNQSQSYNREKEKRGELSHAYYAWLSLSLAAWVIVLAPIIVIFLLLLMAVSTTIPYDPTGMWMIIIGILVMTMVSLGCIGKALYHIGCACFFPAMKATQKGAV